MYQVKIKYSEFDYVVAKDSFSVYIEYIEEMLQQRVKFVFLLICMTLVFVVHVYVLLSFKTYACLENGQFG